jgi:hypothetical protein
MTMDLKRHLIRDLEDWTTVFDRLAMAEYARMRVEEKRAYRAAAARLRDRLVSHLQLVDMMDGAGGGVSANLLYGFERFMALGRMA